MLEPLKELPRRIWLQAREFDTDPLPPDLMDVSWCADKIYDCDEEYIRRDLYEELKEVAFQTGEMLKESTARIKELMAENAALRQDVAELDRQQGGERIPAVQHWCMCAKVGLVARDMRSTCSICGGQDAYGKSPHRPAHAKKTVIAHE